jgi:outer membrane receptor protein involved in Fe transport
VPITVSNPYNGAIEPTFFDLARVEVLRDLQGLLFGSSSMGGMLRFISNTPVLDSFGGYSATTLSGTRRGGINERGDGGQHATDPGQLALPIGVE